MGDLEPGDVFTRPKYPWSDYLQRHLCSPGVNVSKLHPIMGLRVAALFIDLTAAGLASDVPGQGRFQILSGVRTTAQQRSLWVDICLRQKRCAYVASPTTVHRVDGEGVPRQGSNHQEQLQSWGESVGYAVDIRNTAGSSSRAWAPLHDRLATYGLDWPLKTGAVERWHIEAFPRSQRTWLPGPWPQRPGVHRPLKRGHKGGDVSILQTQVGAKADGVFGRGTEAAVKRFETKLGLTANGTWTASNQRAYELTLKPPPPDTSNAKVDAIVDGIESRLDRIETDVDIIEAQLAQIGGLA